MRFSDRIGATKPDEFIYINDVPDCLRHCIWNLLCELYNERAGYISLKWRSLARLLAQNHFKIPTDNIIDSKEFVKERYYKLEWYDYYNLIESIVEAHKYVGSGTDKTRLIDRINTLLERERSGYRFINNLLAPITNELELGEIRSAVSINEPGFVGAQQHLKAAITQFCKRPIPDYRNSIKEAISAVESVAKQIGTRKGEGLAPALRELSKKLKIHKALEEAFIKLYGYASNEEGIRHAILDTAVVGFDEAKYMLVSCSAFINYLSAKAKKAGFFGGDAKEE